MNQLIAASFNWQRRESHSAMNCPNAPNVWCAAAFAGRIPRNHGSYCRQKLFVSPTLNEFDGAHELIERLSITISYFKYLYGRCIKFLPSCHKNIRVKKKILKNAGSVWTWQFRATFNASGARATLLSHSKCNTCYCYCKSFLSFRHISLHTVIRRNR